MSGGRSADGAMVPLSSSPIPGRAGTNTPSPLTWLRCLPCAGSALGPCTTHSLTLLEPPLAASVPSLEPWGPCSLSQVPLSSPGVMGCFWHSLQSALMALSSTGPLVRLDMPRWPLPSAPKLQGSASSRSPQLPVAPAGKSKPRTNGDPPAASAKCPRPGASRDCPGLTR